MTYRNIKEHSEKQVNYFHVRNIDAQYKGRNIFQNISFFIKKGDSLAIMGPNGGGKTTLLSILAGLRSSALGRWGWGQGEDLTGSLHSISKKEMAYLPQQCSAQRTFPLTLRQVVSMGCDDAPSVCALKIKEALQIAQLEAQEHWPISHLSGGQFQRMLWARLMLQEASLLLLDEPFVGMDESTLRLFLERMAIWRAEGRIILMAQHNRARALEHFSHTLLLARDFSVWGPSAEVLSGPAWAQAHEHIQSPHCC